MTSDPKHLHPAAMLFFFYKDIKSWLIPAIVFVFAVYNQSKLWSILGLIAVVVLILINDLLKYFMFSYQFMDDEILVRSGVFVKKVNHIPYDRIQNITANQWFFLKPFKLEELEIETAGHSEGPEVSLAAVPVVLKDELNQYRKKFSSIEVTQNVSRETFSDESDSKRASYSITWRELLKFSLTSPAFLSGLLVVLAFYGKIQHSISKQVYQAAADEFVHLGWLLVAIGLLIVLLVFYIVSVLVLIAKYYHFHLEKEDNQFEMQYGFFKTKRTSISKNRIQAVVIKQTLLRRMLHISSIKLVIISNSKKNETEKDIIIMPVIETDKLNGFLKEFFPHIPVDRLKLDEANVGTYYYDLRNAIIFSLITDVILGLMVFKSSIWLLLAVIIASAIFWLPSAYLNARRARVSIMNDEYVYLQNNQVTSKNSYFVPKNSIQLLDRRQSIWLSKKRFAHIRLSCRSGVGERILKVKYLPQNQIDKVVEWYKRA
ncbi:PH domain-containing protein [Companilactobacillus insicii]|uniref:PH domain-containing protein n=1 Tax=Companilactobacillus insicii TaxID=1732567 RepID=UPI000F7A33C7|nr:PH domain-containing protein [Companilactobacillus insicii]